jgi:hypothetical protein
LQVARECRDGLERKPWEPEPAIAFAWAISRRRRAGSSFEELGPGVCLMTFDRGGKGPTILHRVDDLEFAVIIAREICEAAPERLIEVDLTACEKLVLR